MRFLQKEDADDYAAGYDYRADEVREQVGEACPNCSLCEKGGVVEDWSSQGPAKCWSEDRSDLLLVVWLFARTDRDRRATHPRHHTNGMMV